MPSFATSMLTSAIQVAVLWNVGRGRRTVQGTSLRSAWRLLVVALLAFLAVAVFSALPGVSPSWTEQGAFFTGVLLLSPPIAVLGARRPGASAWTWFVTLPMIVVLMWPALAEWSVHGPPAEMRLEAPQWIGIVVVVTMGCGNYFGTQFTAAAFCYAAAITFLVGPSLRPWPFASDVSRLLSSLALFTATVLAARTSRTRDSTGDPVGDWNALWLEFRDLYGIVWAKRVMDRLNEAARAEKWSLRLELSGFESQSAFEAGIGAAQSIQRVDHWMRVLLRRFVDPVWIDGRIPSQADSAAGAAVSTQRPEKKET